MHDGWLEKRRWIGALSLLCVVVGLYVCMAVRRTQSTTPVSPSDGEAQGTPVEATAVGMAQAGPGRVGEHINLLSKESAEDSLTNLGQAELFFWPGSGWESKQGLAPIIQENARTEDEVLMTVFSNRRFVKVLTDVEQLPPTEAGDTVSRYLRRYLSEYRNLFAEEIVGDDRLYRTRQSAGTGSVGSRSLWDFAIGTPEDGSPTLLGTKLAIFSLVLVAAHLRLDGARVAVEEVLQEGLEQREVLGEPQQKGMDFFLATTALAQASLYNRGVLATALVGLNNGWYEIPALVGKAAQRESALRTEQLFPGVGEPVCESIRLTAYDAARTPFDFDAEGPVDFTRGEVEIQMVHWLSDAVFDEILAWYRETRPADS